MFTAGADRMAEVSSMTSGKLKPRPGNHWKGSLAQPPGMSLVQLFLGMAA